MSPIPDEERSLRMHAIRNAISEGRYSVDTAGVAQAVLARLAVPELREVVLTADAGRCGPASRDSASSALTTDPGRARSRADARPQENH